MEGLRIAQVIVKNYKSSSWLSAEGFILPVDKIYYNIIIIVKVHFWQKDSKTEKKE